MCVCAGTVKPFRAPPLCNCPPLNLWCLSCEHPWALAWDNTVSQAINQLVVSRLPFRLKILDQKVLPSMVSNLNESMSEQGSWKNASTFMAFTLLYFSLLLVYTCNILHSSALYYTILYYTILYYTILYTILYYTILYHTTEQ